MDSTVIKKALGLVISAQAQKNMYYVSVAFNITISLERPNSKNIFCRVQLDIQ